MLSSGIHTSFAKKSHPTHLVLYDGDAAEALKDRLVSSGVRSLLSLWEQKMARRFNCIIKGLVESFELETNEGTMVKITTKMAYFQRPSDDCPALRDRGNFISPIKWEVIPINETRTVVNVSIVSEALNFDDLLTWFQIICEDPSCKNVALFEIEHIVMFSYSLGPPLPWVVKHQDLLPKKHQNDVSHLMAYSIEIVNLIASCNQSPYPIKLIIQPEETHGFEYDELCRYNVKTAEKLTALQESRNKMKVLSFNYTKAYPDFESFASFNNTIDISLDDQNKFVTSSRV